MVLLVQTTAPFACFTCMLAHPLGASWSRGLRETHLVAAFMVHEFDMSLLDTDPRGEHRWGELVQDFSGGPVQLGSVVPACCFFQSGSVCYFFGPSSCSGCSMA